MVYAAVLGYGTVGSGVVEVLEKNSGRIAEKVGEEIKVKYVLDLRDFPGDPIQDRVVHDFEVILNDPEVKIISETMGGNEPAYTFSLPTKNWWQIMGRNFCVWQEKINVIICLRRAWAAAFRLSDRSTLP